MILDADVTKLKCILFKRTWELTQKQIYAIECDTEKILQDINTIQCYLDLITVSMLICRSLECKILDILDQHTITYCNRNVISLPPV